MSSKPIPSDSQLKAEITELRGAVLEYKPGDVSTCADRVEFPDNLFIGLFGRTGCGKTSLINSLKFAAHARLRKSQWQQAAGQEKAGGHTMFRKLADITKKIFVIDNRGLDDPNTEHAITELTAQLDGKRGYSDRIEWQRASDDFKDEDLDLSDLDFDSGHPIGCAVFVFSAQHDIDTNITGLADVIDFLHSHQGRYPVAIITHVDVADDTNVEDLKTVLRVSGVSDIFEVANLTTEKKLLEESYQHHLLSFLERCMMDGDETLIFKHYYRKEQQRKNEIERRRAEKRRKEEEERKAEERRLNMVENERIERENQRRMKLEEHRLEMEWERERAERQARERQEEERDRRYQEAMERVEREKREELRRIMDSNKKDPCNVM